MKKNTITKEIGKSNVLDGGGFPLIILLGVFKLQRIKAYERHKLTKKAKEGGMCLKENFTFAKDNLYY